jgi:hypothetical protein
MEKRPEPNTIGIFLGPTAEGPARMLNPIGVLWWGMNYFDPEHPKEP